MTRSDIEQTASRALFILASMVVRYDIAPTPQGWVVLEDGTPLETHPERLHAVEVAELLATVSKALGRPATVSEPDGG